MPTCQKQTICYNSDIEHHYYKNKAFTLAEVLITLGIIGIVAALTLPSVITKYQKKQTVAQLKKAYSTISQALVTSQYENGNISEWNLSNIAPVTPSGSADQAVAEYNSVLGSILNKYFFPYMDIVDDCGLFCKRQQNVKRTGLNPQEEVSWYSRNHYVTYLKDGTIIAFSLDAKGGDAPAFQYLYIHVDINGDNKPNIYGRDIFVFMFTSATNRVNFAGIDQTREQMKTSGRRGCNKKTTSNSGYYCGALIQHDGWEIKDDYPW